MLIKYHMILARLLSVAMFLTIDRVFAVCSQCAPLLSVPGYLSELRATCKVYDV